jgi:hypothetical protein
MSDGGEGGIILSGQWPDRLHESGFAQRGACAHGGQTLLSDSHPSEARSLQMVSRQAVGVIDVYGEGGIRTLGALLELGALAKLCFRPLSHLTS